MTVEVIQKFLPFQPESISQTLENLAIGSVNNLQRVF